MHFKSRKMAQQDLGLGESTQRKLSSNPAVAVCACTCSLSAGVRVGRWGRQEDSEVERPCLRGERG